MNISSSYPQVSLPKSDYTDKQLKSIGKEQTPTGLKVAFTALKIIAALTIIFAIPVFKLIDNYYIKVGKESIIPTTKKSTTEGNVIKTPSPPKDDGKVKSDTIKPLNEGLVSEPNRVSSKNIIKTTKKPQLTPIPVADDGNCLFYSTIYGLRHLNKNPPKDQSVLRKNCADWLTTNIERDDVRQSLTEALNDYKASQQAKLTPELQTLQALKLAGHNVDDQILKLAMDKNRVDNMTIQDYAQLLKQDKFFGGEAAILALSEIYHVKVIVQQVMGNISFGEQPVAGNQFNDTLYLKRDISKNHYDALVATAA